MKEGEDLRSKAGEMSLRMSPRDASERGLRHGEVVEAVNDLGHVLFRLDVSEEVPAGVVIAPGVRRREDARGERTINALTSQRLTDEGGGSTFYDNVEIG